MSGKVLEEFNEQIGDLKNKIYDVMVRNNVKDEPGSLDALRAYEQLLKKIFIYWKDLYAIGPRIRYTIDMQSQELQELFREKTQWFLQNIVSSKDMDVRNYGLSILDQNCQKDPYNLKGTT